MSGPRSVDLEAGCFHESDSTSFQLGNPGRNLDLVPSAPVSLAEQSNGRADIRGP